MDSLHHSFRQKRTQSRWVPLRLFGNTPQTGRLEPSLGSILMWVIAAMTTRFLIVRAEFRVSEDLAHRCLTGQMKFKSATGEWT